MAHHLGARPADESTGPPRVIDTPLVERAIKNALYAASIRSGLSNVILSQ
jgi:hypothetical protein